MAILSVFMLRIIPFLGTFKLRIHFGLSKSAFQDLNGVPYAKCLGLSMKWESIPLGSSCFFPSYAQYSFLHFFKCGYSEVLIVWFMMALGVVGARQQHTVRN